MSIGKELFDLLNSRGILFQVFDEIVHEQLIKVSSKESLLSLIQKAGYQVNSFDSIED